MVFGKFYLYSFGIATGFLLSTKQLFSMSQPGQKLIQSMLELP